MTLAYGVKDKPKAGQLIVFAFQQLLAILAATIVVPVIVGHGMAQSAALFGAGIGTLIYQICTKFRSPVFLGSSFAFLGSMAAAFAGGVSAALGFAGIIIGAAFAGLVYVVIAIIVKIAGVNWINKLMPACVIGPTVAIIGLSLAGNAIGDSLGGATSIADGYLMTKTGWAFFICALVTLFVVMICSVYGKKTAKLIPFIIGIAAGYIVATVFTVSGVCQVIDFSKFSGMKLFAVPEFTFITGLKGLSEITGSYIATIAVAYIPVAFVVFAEHIADHKNLSSIIGTELLEDPGLHRTLLGDGIGSMVGAFFGGCPNTTYGESIGCVAITGNASVITITTTAIIAILASFFNPFIVLLSSIPSCVMGGVCITLYGFIAVSGLKMIQNVDLGENRNLFVVAVVLISGIGGMKLCIGTENTHVTLTAVACALILGIITNLVLNKRDEKAEVKAAAQPEAAEETEAGNE